MTTKLIDQLTDGVDLAVYLHSKVNDREELNLNERRESLRYLGQCLKSMKEQINDDRELNKDTTECRC